MSFCGSAFRKQGPCGLSRCKNTSYFKRDLNGADSAYTKGEEWNKKIS